MAACRVVGHAIACADARARRRAWCGRTVHGASTASMFSSMAWRGEGACRAPKNGPSAASPARRPPHSRHSRPQPRDAAIECTARRVHRSAAFMRHHWPAGRHPRALTGLLTALHPHDRIEAVTVHRGLSAVVGWPSAQPLSCQCSRRQSQAKRLVLPCHRMRAGSRVAGRPIRWMSLSSNPTSQPVGRGASW